VIPLWLQQEADEARSEMISLAIFTGLIAMGGLAVCGIIYAIAT